MTEFINFSILSGKRAVEGNTIPELRAKHCNGQLSQLSPNLSKDIANLIEKCQYLNPALRYDSWAEVATKLEYIYSNNTGQAAPKISSIGKSSLDEHVETGWSFVEIGLAYSDIGKPESALDYYERAKKIGSDVNDQRMICIALANTGIAEKNLGRFQKALNLHEEAIAISKNIKDSSIEQKEYANLAATYLAVGHNQEAIAYLENSLSIARELGEKFSEAVDLSNLGIAYRNLGKLHEALQFFQQSLDIRVEISDRRGIGISLSNFGNVYRETGDFQRSLHFYERALVNSNEIGNPYLEMRVCTNVGSMLMERGNLIEALEYLQRALNISIEVRAEDDKALIQYNLASLYLSLAQAEKAVQLLKDTIDFWSLTGRDDNMIRDAKTLLKVSEEYIGSGGMRDAIRAFNSVDTYDAMKEAAAKNPYMLREDFIKYVRNYIEERADRFNIRDEFEKRLGWLVKIAGSS